MIVSKIENGIVVNIIEADSVQWCIDNLEESTYVDSQNGLGQIGTIWDGTTFTNPAEDSNITEHTPGEFGELPVEE